MSPRRSELLRAAIRELYPGYFALVMATGILSNAFFMQGLHRLSTLLFAVNLVAFPSLFLATGIRVARFRRALWADLTDPRLVFSFFTTVAASNVLGVQAFLRGHVAGATALWLAALAGWIVLGYFSFSVLIFVSTRRNADVVHGGWLIAIVGTESLVLLGTMLAPELGRFSALTFVAVHAVWGIGIILYGIFVTLFSYRIFFAPLQPASLMPLVWVVMGAAAISANAGSALILCRPIVPFLSALRPFVEGTTLILWAWATWWIPLLVILGVWKHVVHRVPLTYHPMYWSLVFPLGMYSVASHRLSLAADFPPLRLAARGMMWVAFAAWCVTATAMLRRLLARAPATPEGA